MASPSSTGAISSTGSACSHSDFFSMTSAVGASAREPGAGARSMTAASRLPARTTETVIPGPQACCGGPEIRRPAEIKNFCSWGMAIEMRCPAPPGTLLRIEFDDGVVLGESVHCREAAGAYYVGITLDQALKSLANLAFALDELSGGAQEEKPRSS